MIRVLTLNDFDDKQLEKLCRHLYTSFGVGCEHSKKLLVPPGMTPPYDAPALIKEIDSVRAYPDDKLLYLTSDKLKDRALPSGNAPTAGYCQYGKDRALVSIHPATDLEAKFKHIARNALHQLGHCWELHHCLDPRCSMYLPWTPSFATGEPVFCTFCREKSEQKIRLAKS